MPPPFRQCGSMYSRSRGDLGAWFFRWIIILIAVGIAIGWLIDYSNRMPT